MKVFAHRDSATAVLRKLGINPRDYSLFISRSDEGFKLNVDLAKKHLKDLEIQMAPKPKATTRTRKTRTPKAGKPPTISDICRSMVLTGATNEAIMEVLVETFGADRFNDDKRHYPAWYRCEMRRKGLLMPIFDVERRDGDAIHKFED